MNLDNLTRRVDSAIAGLEQRRIEQNALPVALEWIRAGLMSKLALLSDQGLTGDFAARCAEIDQDQARRQSPAIRAALALYSRRYPVAGAREQLMMRLSGMNSTEYRDFLTRCKQVAGETRDA